MKYVLQILKHELKKEKSYESQHRAAAAKAEHISDQRMYEMSVRNAQERIPQLKTAIKILSNKYLNK